MISSITIAENVRMITEKRSQKLFIKKMLRSMGFSEEQINGKLSTHSKKLSSFN